MRKLHRRAGEFRAAVFQHPKQAAALAICGLILIWLILTTTFAAAIAEASPKLALWLNPNQPTALVALAERARAKLLGLTLAEARPDDPVSPGESNSASASPTGGNSAEQRKTLRAEIRSLTMRTIAADPLNATAYRMLAEVTDDPASRRALMQEAVKRSRHESRAVFWLMMDSFEQKDFHDTIAKADILLRTRPQLAAYVISYLVAVAAEPEGRVPLVALLAQNPPWRGTFFSTLPRSSLTDAPLDLMLALKETRSPPAAKELAPYLNGLASKDLYGAAYNAWLQFLPEEKLASLKLLNNPEFAEEPTGPPFDWQIGRGINAIAELIPLRSGDGRRALHLNFGVGRIKFPQVSEIVMLGAGRYRLTGEFQGAITAKRGLRWQFRCAAGKKGKLAETDMISGHLREWQTFALDVEVPASEDCEAQLLRLFHDARSASEEMISGEIYFRNLDLVRIEGENTP